MSSGKVTAKETRERVKTLRKFMRGFGSGDGYNLREDLSRGQKSAVTRAWNDLQEKLQGQPVIVGRHVSGPKHGYHARPLERGERLEEFQDFDNFTPTEKKKYKVAIVHTYSDLRTDPSGGEFFYGGPDDTAFDYEPSRPRGSRVVMRHEDLGYSEVSVPLDAWDEESIDEAIEEYAPDAEYFGIQTKNGTIFNVPGYSGDRESIADAVRKMVNKYANAGQWFVGLRAYSDKSNAMEYGRTRVEQARKRRAAFKQTPAGKEYGRKKTAAYRERQRAEREIQRQIAELVRERIALLRGKQTRAVKRRLAEIDTELEALYGQG